MPHQCTECGRTFDDGSKQMLSGCPDCGGNKFQFQPSSAQSDARTAANESGAADATDAEPGANPDERARTNPDERAKANPDETPTDPSQPDADSADTGVPDDRATRERASSDSGSTPAGSDQPDAAEIGDTADEDRAQRDARSTPATRDEIERARREVSETEGGRPAEEREPSTDERRPGDDEEDSANPPPTHGRGTPQGPPTDGPDEDAAEQFGLDGPVGGHDEQPSADTTASTPEPSGEGDSGADTVDGPETDLSALREELNDQFESIKITAPGQYELNLMELYDRKEYIISLQEDGRYVVDIPEGHEYRDE